MIEDLTWTPDGNTLLWIKSRDGRNTIVEQALDDAGMPSAPPRHLPIAADVRGQIAYGGGAFAASDDAIFFTAREGLFRLPQDGGDPRPLLPIPGRVAAPTPSPDGRWILPIHHAGGVATLLLLDTAGLRWPQAISRSADFFMQPSWHPDGQRIAWIAWDTPAMPWDRTRLVLARLRFANGICVGKDATVIASGAETAISQVAFSPDGHHLAYVSDAPGRGQLYLYDFASGTSHRLTDLPGELDLPSWRQGIRTFTFDATGQTIYAVENRDARSTLWIINVATGECRQAEGFEAFTDLSQPIAHPQKARVALIAASPTRPPRVIIWRNDKSSCENMEYRSVPHTIQTATNDPSPPASLATAKTITIEGRDARLHCILYRPTAEHALDDNLPPAIVHLHGGPTAQARLTYDLRAQFFASRGVVFLDVNYRGSSGYGRAFRRALEGLWGIADIADALAARDHLATKGIAHPDQIVLMGESAGGATVLRTLAAHPGHFAAGIVTSGTTDLLNLAARTHPFEAHYLDRLIGPLPKSKTPYGERSPITSATAIVDPVAIFHGEDDRVIPKEQAEGLVELLRERGIPHAYHLYPGEGHGFRHPETIRRYWTAIETFLTTYVFKT